MKKKLILLIIIALSLSTKGHSQFTRNRKVFFGLQIGMGLTFADSDAKKYMVDLYQYEIHGGWNNPNQFFGLNAKAYISYLLLKRIELQGGYSASGTYNSKANGRNSIGQQISISNSVFRLAPELIVNYHFFFAENSSFYLGAGHCFNKLYLDIGVQEKYEGDGDGWIINAGFSFVNNVYVELSFATSDIELTKKKGYGDLNEFGSNELLLSFGVRF